MVSLVLPPKSGAIPMRRSASSKVAGVRAAAKMPGISDRLRCSAVT